MALGILCSGQGGQTPDMLDILQGEPAAQAVLDAAAEAMGVDPRRLVAGPLHELHRNAVAQPVLCAAALATWVALRPRLPPVRAFAGYSVGELAAYGCAGALEIGELVTLAGRRAAAMDGACSAPNGLLAVRGLERGVVETLGRSYGVAVAIVNDVDRLVVGGLSDGLNRFEAAVTALGAGVTPLPVAVASHTSLMAPAAAIFGHALAASGLKRPLTPVLAGIDGTAIRRRDDAQAALTAQIAHTIDWAACMDSLVEMGCTVLLELGPGAALARMVRDRHVQVAARSVAEFRSLAGVIDWVGRQIGHYEA
jgi:[acyl-carrier-protein] S-malonyltransferase